MPDSQITHRPLATLTPWARNARTHSTKQIRQIDASSLVGGGLSTNKHAVSPAGFVLPEVSQITLETIRIKALK